MASKHHQHRLQKVAAPDATNKLRRSLWRLVFLTVFRWSPTWAHGWRCQLLRLFGAEIKGQVFVYPDTEIWAPWNLIMRSGSCLGPRVNCYCVGKITLADDALVSQGVHLCSASHDHRDPTFPLIVGDIDIGSHAWVAADAFVGPGVVIGAQAVVGARAVVIKDVDPGIVVAGNPAVPTGKR